MTTPENACHLCEHGFPLGDGKTHGVSVGIHYASQSKGMIPNTPCAAFVCERYPERVGVGLDLVHPVARFDGCNHGHASSFEGEFFACGGTLESPVGNLVKE